MAVLKQKAERCYLAVRCFSRSTTVHGVVLTRPDSEPRLFLYVIPACPDLLFVLAACCESVATSHFLTSLGMKLETLFGFHLMGDEIRRDLVESTR